METQFLLRISLGKSQPWQRFRQDDEHIKEDSKKPWMKQGLKIFKNGFEIAQFWEDQLRVRGCLEFGEF